MTSYNLKDRVVLITGSTGGLGSGICKELVAKGAKVALFDLNQTAIDAQVKALGSNTRGWEVDVRSMESIENATEEAARHFGKIDVVIANAGITAFEPLITGNSATFDRVIDINLNGVWRTLRAAAPHVIAQKGYMMAISSLAAFSHSPLQSSYTGSKAGVWAMCNSIRLDMRHLGVDVGTVHPTFFHTAMMDQAFDDPAGNKIWKGNESGLFKMVPLETVLKLVIRGVETRAETVFAPKENRLVSWFPAFLRKMIGAVAFKDQDVEKMIEAANQS